MGVSCIVDFILGKVGLVGEQNVMNRIGVRIDPTTVFQLATHVHRFKMLNVLDVVWIAHKVNTREHISINAQCSSFLSDLFTVV
jgi:hypothetical protein